MGNYRKKRSQQEATQDVFEKETGVRSANAQLELLSVSTMSLKQKRTLCGLPSPWQRGRGRKKVRNSLTQCSNCNEPFRFPYPT